MEDYLNADLLCFCHLRWNFVFQRPQHLMSRYRGRVFFVEEPVFGDLPDVMHFTATDRENVVIATPHLNQRSSMPVTERLRELLDDLLEIERINTYICWYYSPMALEFSDHLVPQMTIYDCMDELSAFRFAPEELKSIERQLLSISDVVFTGGNKLFEAKKSCHSNMYAFPSSIDKQHFLRARNVLEEPVDQQSIPRPRLGFYGVLDERLDLTLIDELARARPEWNIILLGPVVKIDPHTLPHQANIYYLGAKKYNELPGYLSGWDIAIMPFAINESTEFISPTKTPEYLAGGKPVISTPITDVVNDYGSQNLVASASNVEEFIRAAEEIFQEKNRDLWLARVDERLSRFSWDITWDQMGAIMDSTLNRKAASKVLVEKTVPVSLKQ